MYNKFIAQMNITILIFTIGLENEVFLNMHNLYVIRICYKIFKFVVLCYIYEQNSNKKYVFNEWVDSGKLLQYC